MYHALYVFTLLFIKLFNHIPETIEEHWLWINSYTNNYGICTECYIATARSKGGYSDLKGIVRDLFQCHAGKMTIDKMIGDKINSRHNGQRWEALTSNILLKNRSLSCGYIFKQNLLEYMTCQANILM